MTRLRSLLLVSLLLLAVISISGPQTNGGRIQVTVLRGESTVGVPQAILILNIPAGGGNPATQRVVTADGSGRFEFTGLPPGSYTVQASAAGYYGDLAGVFNQRTTATTTIRPQALNTSLTLRLKKTGVISGRLRDADGRPVSNVSVAANRVEFRGGQPTLVTMQYTPACRARAR